MSHAGLDDLLGGWRTLDLEPVEIADSATGDPFKRVWRGAARR